MVGQPNGTTDAQLTRRKAIAGVGAVALGGTSLAVLGSETAQADVTMGEFSASGDAATLSDAPTALDVSASGEWSVDTPGALDQVMLTLQTTVEGMTDDVATERVFDDTSGDYQLQADVIDDHRDVDADLFAPDDAGDTKTTDVDVAVIVSAVKDGSISAEARAEDTATVEVTREGVEVRVGGSAELSIVGD